MTVISYRVRLARETFQGFIPASQLQTPASRKIISTSPGVYALVRIREDEPQFRVPGTASPLHRKGDPNVPLELLTEAWVPGCDLVYIGKADISLRGRLALYFRFGSGSRSAMHWGGRYIWQLADADDLLVCWRATAPEPPQAVEDRILADFKREHGRLPFANRRS